jgi:hypothetical protein
MRPHIELTVNERERFSVRVPVVRQYADAMGSFLLIQAVSVFFCALEIQGDFPVIQLSQAYLAYLLRVDGASIAADPASRLGHSSRRLCSTSETGEK